MFPFIPAPVNPKNISLSEIFVNEVGVPYTAVELDTEALLV